MSISIIELNELLLEKFEEICDEYDEISLRGEIVDCRFFKNNVGISFKIKDGDGMFNCKCWNFRGIDINKIKRCENSICVVSGIIKSNYFNNHYDFVLELNDDIKEDVGKSVIKSLKEECEVRGYLTGKKKVDWSLIKKVGIISKKDTQGYNDFISQLEVDIEIVLKEIVLEGVNTEKTLIKAIEEFQEEDVDVILIIRGGGSTIDISNSYDKMSIFEIMRNSMKPIITAIGHEADKDERLLITSISDMDYPTPSRLVMEINSLILDDKFKRLRVLLEKYVRDRFDGGLMVELKDEKFMIIKKGGKCYKIEINAELFKDEFKMDEEELDIRRDIEEGISNRDINLIKKRMEKIKDESEILTNIRKILT